MANPYKKADQKPKAAPGGQRPVAPVVPETPGVEEPIVTPVVETPVEDKPVVKAPVTKPATPKPAPKKEEPKDDIEDLFPDIIEEKPNGKPKTLYLDADVVDVLEKLAKKKKMSASKVANALLRNALIGK